MRHGGERGALVERAPAPQSADLRIGNREEAAFHPYAVGNDRGSADPALYAADVAIPGDPDLSSEARPPGVFSDRSEEIRWAGSRPVI